MEQEKLPYSTTSLVLGILSILTCICYGLVGLPLGIIAYLLGKKALLLFKEDPSRYRQEGNAAAGKILGMIGVFSNLIYLLLVIWVLYKIGWDALQDPEEFNRRIEDLRLLSR